MSRKETYDASSLILVAGVDAARWNRSPSSQDISSTASALDARRMRVVLVEDGAQALDALKKDDSRGCLGHERFIYNP
jgi:hypothetical protein